MPDLLVQRKNIHRQLEQDAQTIESLEKQLTSTQKLATLGTMACIMAHEFNNILMPIINYAELAQRDLTDQAMLLKALDKIIKNGQMASDMIENLLGFSRDNSQKYEDIPLLKLVQDCFLCLVRDLKKDSIQVDIEIADNLSIHAIRGQMQQVLLNMFINARQAMLERGGRLTVRGRETAAETLIEIADTGCGIENDHLEFIFDPFFSTKSGQNLSEEGGTGLGLMVCRTIIEDHGGSIAVVSTPRKGTCFSIHLPKSR